jgi:GTP cyclohydrolase IA
METISTTAQAMEYPVNSPEWHMQQILIALKEDPQREGLQQTPKRYIKFLREFLTPQHFEFTTFIDGAIDEMIIQSDIPFYSLCEHHIAPFFGTAAVAYIPDGKVIGLSKLARVVDLYANRLQNQERITQQVAQRLMSELLPKGVAVTLRAQHLCMCMRGVKKHDTWTTTTSLLGTFKTNSDARQEFLKFVK